MFLLSWVTILLKVALTLSLTSASVIDMEAVEYGTCQSIEKVSLCSNLDYNAFFLPNQRGHCTIEEMTSELDDFFYFVLSQCSNSIVHFLCYYFAPPCTGEQPQLGGQPCRELCEYTRDNCLKAFDGLRIHWPSSMNCSSFSYKNETNTCYGPSDPATLVIPETLIMEQDNTPTGEVTLEPSLASYLFSRTNFFLLLLSVLAILLFIVYAVWMCVCIHYLFVCL